MAEVAVRTASIYHSFHWYIYPWKLLQDLNVPLSSCHAKPKLNAKSTDLPQLLSRMEMNRSIQLQTEPISTSTRTTTTTATLRYTHALHYTTLHCTALHYTTLHYTTLHSTPPPQQQQELELQLHYTTLHSTSLRYTAHNYTRLHYITLHYANRITLHYANYITLHELHYTTLCYILLHYTTLH